MESADVVIAGGGIMGCALAYQLAKRDVDVSVLFVDIVGYPRLAERLAGAEAIQRIINDRNTLRSCTTAQQRDLATLNSINQELRRRLGLIRHHYVELATRILTQLEQFDQATREATRDYGQTVPVGESDDDKLPSLARRLKPANASSNPADEGAPAAR